MLIHFFALAIFIFACSDGGMLMTGNVAFLGLAPLPQGGFGSLVANIDVT